MNRRDLLAYGTALGGALVFSNSLGDQATTERGDVLRRDLKAGPVSGADLAVVNAKVITLEPSQPRASAVLARNGRIALVGSNRDVLAHARGIRVFDAGGQVLVPGFVDAHTHLEMACQARAYQLQCQTPPYLSLREIFEEMRSRAASTPRGKWVIARSSFNMQEAVQEKRLATRIELDSISEDHPVALFAGLHITSLNTRALKELGLFDESSAANLRWKDGRIRKGTSVPRDANGIPIGVATEIYDLMPAYALDETRQALSRYSKELFVAKGITSATTMPILTNDDFRADQELQRSGGMPIRLRTYYIVPQRTTLQGVIDMGLLPGMGDDWFRFGGVKFFVDGTEEDGLGNPLADYKWTQEELNAAVLQAHAAGLQILMHVIGRGAMDMAVTAIEAALRVLPKPHRHRLEHAYPIESAADVRRLMASGIRATFTPEQVRLPASDGADRRNPPVRTMIREGFEPMSCTDVAGTIPVFSPLVGIASFVATPAEGGGTPRDENVSFEDALRTWTIWSAKGAFEESEKGSLGVGKLADYAILSADPEQRSGPELFDVEVSATIVGGTVVYER
jgi:hypothetical protein